MTFGTTLYYFETTSAYFVYIKYLGYSPADSHWCHVDLQTVFHAMTYNYEYKLSYF
jgi:hypothetical protein